MLQVTVNRRHLMVFVAVVTLVVSVAWVGVASRADAASSTPVVYVATGENFPDALGAAAAAAVQGGPVLLVTKTAIPAETKAELSRLAPDMIYVSGGTAVVSDTVFNALKDYAPSVVRVAGANRYSTAVEVSKSAFPATAGGGGDVAALTAAVNALTARVDALESANTALEGEVDALQATLSGVSRDGTTLLFEGMNLQVVNGLDDTSTSNSLGNVVIGYNEDNPVVGISSDRTGSHYLIVGDEHSWTKWGGIVAGLANQASGSFATVTGGVANVAGGTFASVTGGDQNKATTESASVSGGYRNTASGDHASVSGGGENTADRPFASVSGGRENWANESYSWVSGGWGNIANGYYSSVSAGWHNTASGYYSSVSGGASNEANNTNTSVSGGQSNLASNTSSSVSGGSDNTASGGAASVCGGFNNTASHGSSAILGGSGISTIALYYTYPNCTCTTD